jgi:small subunit ribosomal protein S3Ae
MVEIITRDITSSDLKEVVNKLLPDSIAKDIEKACQGIYPLHDVYIRKVMSHVKVMVVGQPLYNNTY